MHQQQHRRPGLREDSGHHDSSPQRCPTWWIEAERSCAPVMERAKIRCVKGRGPACDGNEARQTRGDRQAAAAFLGTRHAATPRPRAAASKRHEHHIWLAYSFELHRTCSLGARHNQVRAAPFVRAAITRSAGTGGRRFALITFLPDSQVLCAQRVI